MELKNIINTWKNIFADWKYSLLTVFIAILFYSLNITISSWRVFTEFSSDRSFLGAINTFLYLFFNFGKTIKFSSFISLILISILFGILFSLIFYKAKTNVSIKKSTGIFGGTGLFLAVLVPGCAACGIGLISLLGISAGVLSFLPYRGLELSVLSILILGFAIVKLTNEMYICKFSNSFEKMKNTGERR